MLAGPSVAPPRIRFGIGISPCPLPAADVMLLGHLDALLPGDAECSTVVVPDGIALDDVVDALRDRAEALSRRAAVVVDVGEPLPADDQALLAGVDDALGLDPLDASVRAARGRWLQRRQGDLGAMLIVATETRGDACEQLLKRLTRLIHDCRDTDGKPSALGVIRGPLRAPELRPRLLPAPAVIGGQGLAVSVLVSWERYLARRLYWESGGRFDRSDVALSELARFRNQDPAPGQIEGALDRRAATLPLISPPPERELDDLLVGKVSGTQAIADAHLGELWARGAVWAVPGEDRVEVVAGYARRWAALPDVSDTIRRRLCRWAVRSPPVTADAATRILRIEERLRRWLRSSTRNGWESLLEPGRMNALHDEHARASTDAGREALMRDPLELSDALDTATLRDMANIADRARLGSVDFRRGLDDLWRIRNNTMHGRTPTWVAVRAVDQAERLLEMAVAR